MFFVKFYYFRYLRPPLCTEPPPPPSGGTRCPPTPGFAQAIDNLLSEQSKYCNFHMHRHVRFPTVPFKFFASHSATTLAFFLEKFKQKIDNDFLSCRHSFYKDFNLYLVKVFFPLLPKGIQSSPQTLIFKSLYFCNPIL